MIYDITKPLPPEMPPLGKGMETQRLLLSQTSKDMFEPEHPMLYAPLGSKISGAEFQYPSGQWLEPCGQIRLLCADSGNNKGQQAQMAAEKHGGFYEELDRRLVPLALCKGRFVIPQLNNKVCQHLAAEICEYAVWENTNAVWENTNAVWENTNAVWENTNAVLENTNAFSGNGVSIL